ncbi:unnamed protein product, partial [Prunus brigantina]
MVSTQFQVQVKEFQTDNEGKYVNNTLACFFCAQGIIHQTKLLLPLKIMLSLKGRTDNCLKLSAHSYWICSFPIIAVSILVLSS